MISLERQIQLSSDLAERLLEVDTSADPLETWHSGIEVVRTRIQDPDLALTEDLLDVSAIAYRAYSEGQALVQANSGVDPQTILDRSADIMFDLTRQHTGIARRCGNYLLTAYSLHHDANVLTIADDKLTVSDTIRGQLEEGSTFCYPELLPLIWNAASRLVRRKSEVK